ncbi:hypothetical protein amb1846 [Paramagnetospirillum magneticum AMB-1]|uniref:Uncharacterized protein n=1 Tax=Paramagnetospirillum magneticum (strain ATCC 700264 / AMB-1) TaxID=342108 RepID=Q2W675_PARM1|nr:hypothetical protein amb1846 [Paramagnetospirillum magneticum AMB-1]
MTLLFVGRFSGLIRRAGVPFPAPERPMMSKIPLLATSRDTPRSTGTGPAGEWSSL